MILRIEEQIKEGTTLKQFNDIVEREVLQQCMTKYVYNKSKTARESGISRGSLVTKLKYHFGNKYFLEQE